MIDENDPELLSLLIANEGWKPKPYKDSLGIWTIGYGYNMQAHGLPARLVKPVLNGLGITKVQAAELLKTELHVCVVHLHQIFSRFEKFSRARQMALIDMRFNMGPGNPKTKRGFLGMKNMVAAVKNQNWALAALEAEDSAWYRTVKSRGPRIVRMIREG